MRFVPLIFGIFGTVVLVSFGLWQLQRAEWKDGLLGEMEARLGEAPVALPAAPDADADRFRAVALKGRIVGDPFAVFGTWRGAGAGYKIFAPFETDGRRVIVDFGVAPKADVMLPETEIALTGNLHFVNETEASPEADVWTNQDVAAMAARSGAAPVLVVARESISPAIRAVPLDTAGISDNHMGYAVQWFGLAIVWAGMAGYFVWRQRKGTA